jgi:hypothetical protein
MDISNVPAALSLKKFTIVQPAATHVTGSVLSAYTDYNLLI